MPATLSVPLVPFPMSIDSIKRQIEGYKRDIDRQKSTIADCREDMANIRIRKSRDADSYTRRLKSASSVANKHSIRAQKKRDWEGYARKLDNEKDKIAKCRDRIKGYREDISRCRERIKRLR